MNSLLLPSSKPSALPFGVLAYSGAALSLGFCFAKTILLYLTPVLGLGASQFDINPHLQALMMWLFVLVGVVGLFFDRGRCGSNLPVTLGAVSFVVIVTTLYAYYQIPILMLSLIHI